ncbi:hypothetical protein KFE25_005398 [Diacronema lutheri]|uniref:Flavin-containing monooxygenase n=1 Tax=Diacronema lutheri TaxID=2081491 RepID=A0A8J5XF14_DIALT|nr:hypothetical protein KFE25_005398 [Diacronema lutheri]
MRGGDEAKEIAVGIVGAGVAGLQQARALKARGISCIVFDLAPRPGGLWRENYVSYGVQVPVQLYEFPDFPYRPRSVLADLFPQEYADGAMMQEYIERYVQHFELEPMLSLRTRVLSLQRRADGKAGWTITYSRNGATSTVQVDYAVIATGMYSAPPNVPEYPGASEFVASGGAIIHSSKYTDGALAEGKRVLVVGGAKSAIDITIDSATRGKSARSTLVFRHAHWGTPRLLAWFLPSQYVFLSRLGQLLVSLKQGAYPAGGPRWIDTLKALPILGWIVSGVMALAFRLAEELIALQLGHYGEWRPSLPMVCDLYGYGHVLSPQFRQLRARKQFDTVRGEVVRLAKGVAIIKADPVRGCFSRGSYSKLAEEVAIPCELIVCATGFRKTYDYLPKAELAALDVQEDGVYLYRHIFPPAVPDLAFCGAEIATMTNIMTHAIHAEYIARVVARELALPTREQMQREVDTVREWKRSWMPKTASRAALVMLHQTHYHDQLLIDLGMPWSRKGNPLAVAFMPCQPSDYDGVIGANATSSVRALQ